MTGVRLCEEDSGAQGIDESGYATSQKNTTGLYAFQFDFEIMAATQEGLRKLK